MSGSDDKSVKIWDATTGKCEATLYEHQEYVPCRTLRLCDAFLRSAVLSVRFHPGGNVIAAGSADNTIKIWFEISLLARIQLIVFGFQGSAHVHARA